MKEYVTDAKEFRTLIQGRIHWAIKRNPLYVSNVHGTGKMNIGDHDITLSITGISRDDSAHVVVMDISFGNINKYEKEKYKAKIGEAVEFAKKHFPEATEGAFA